MRKIQKIILVVIVAFLLPSITAFAEGEVTKVTDLIDKGREFDSKTVNIEGEAIGELLERGEYSFVNINDGTSAMGVYLKTVEGETIKTYGDYHNIGDKVLVLGTFNRACSEHGGDMDIHSHSIKIVSKGYKNVHEIEKWKIVGIVVLAPFVGIGLVKVNRIMRKNKKESKEN